MIKITTRFKPNSNAHRGRDPYYQTKKHKALREAVKKRDKGICQGCLKATDKLHIAGKYSVCDHIIPRGCVDISRAIKPDGFTDEEFDEVRKAIISASFDYDILENLWLVCKKYHDVKSAKERR